MTKEEPIHSFEAAEFLGEQIIEMAERVRIAHKVVPGTVAKYSFEMDGEIYAVTLRVADKAGAGK